MSIEGKFNTHYTCKHGIAYACDVFPKIIRSDIHTIDETDYANIRPYDKVYVITSTFNIWFKTIYPRLIHNKIPIFLITGDSTQSAPLGVFKNNSVILNAMLSEGIILHWFCQNCDYPTCNQVSPIPLGIDFHTLHRGTGWGEPHTSFIDQDANLAIIANKNIEWNTRKNTVLLDAHLTSYTNPTDRLDAFQVLNKKPFVELLPSSQPRTEYWNTVSQYKFIISPLGKGLDCHRTWEALILGTIPIIKRTTISSLFDNLPVLQVNSYSDITEELLVSFEKSVRDNLTSFSFEKTSLAYWNSFIADTITKLRMPLAPVTKKRACITGCIRNLYEGRECIVNIVHQFKTALPGCIFVFVESDSTDGTREWLKEFNRIEKSVYVIFAGDLKSTIPSRTARIAHCRNLYLKFINRYTDKFDILIPVDLDSALQLPDGFKDICDRFIESSYTAIFGNTPIYYDIWALRSKECPTDCWIEIRREMAKGRSREKARTKYVKSHQKAISPTSPWINVQSAFNCIGIYKLAHLKNAGYWGLQIDPNEQIVEMCEHVHFHRMLSRFGCKFAIAPNLYLNTKSIGMDHL